MTKKIKTQKMYSSKILIAIYCLFSYAVVSGQNLSPTLILDRVYFGSSQGEQQHNVLSENAPAIRGGLAQSARIIGIDGGLTFTVKSDPVLPNLITIRLWGDDVKQVVEAFNGESFRMEARQIDIYVGDEKLSEESVELLDDKPLLPGRFFYRTAAIPLELTKGQEQITITIKPAGQVGGDYAAVGGPAPEKAQAGSYSRGVYAAYTHTDNLFVPPSDEVFLRSVSKEMGTVVKPMPDEGDPNFDKIRYNLIRSIDEAVDELINRQLYGSKFEQAKKELGIPAKVTGLFDWTGLKSYINRGRSRDFEPQDSQWLTPVTGSASGRGHTAAGHLFMAAYSLEGSKYYRDEQMIKRTLAALDGYCRYQGKDGGFEIGGGDWGWVGGPQRRGATGGLPGFFARGLANSFLSLKPVLNDHPQIMQELIDNNGDGEKNITRTDAYTQLFRDWLWKDYPRLGLRTACANQDLSNGYGAIIVNDCLKYLSPEDTFPENIIIATAKKNVGLMPIDPELERFIHSLTDSPSDRGGSQYMISAGGITMEWGFCPLYGQHFPPTLSDMCRRIDEPFIKEQFNLYISGIENFVIPYAESGEFSWLVQGAIGSRRRPIFFTDFKWQNFVYPADELQNEAAIRMVQAGLASYGDFSNYSHGAQDRMHLCSRASETLELLNNLDSLERVWLSKSTDYRLPVERQGEYVWTDPTSSARVLDPVLIKTENQEILYIQNNRYHLITDKFHSYGTAHINKHDYLAQAVFGDYLIVVNRSDTPDVDAAGSPRVYNPPQGLVSAVDLLSGKAVDLTAPLLLQPRRAYIFDISQSPDIAATEKPQIKFTKSEIDQKTDTAFWHWQVRFSEGAVSDDVVILSLPKGHSSESVIESFAAGGDVLSAYYGQNDPLEILAVGTADKMIAISGIEAAANEYVNIKVAGLLPSFTDYSQWSLKTEGGRPLAHRASIVELRHDNALEWRLLDSAEDASSSSSITQRTNDWMSFSYPLKDELKRIEFDYTGGGIDRFVIELRDGKGSLLWDNQSQDAPKRRIVLDDVAAKQQLEFRVGVKSSHVYAGTFHRIENIRLEYAK